MVFIIYINRPPYKYFQTCDWSRNLKKSLKISMWNGIPIVKNDKNHDKLNFQIWKNIYIEKILVHLTIELFIWWWHVCIFYFDIIMTFFWIHNYYFLCVTNIMSSFQKSTMNPFLKTKSSIFLIRLSLKSIATWIMKKLKILMFDMILHFKFIYNLEKI
jgi:hypothetical protein